MASLNKQQKRAKRAKAKAKQINIHGRKPAALDDDIGHLDEPIPEYTLAMFSKMRDAEAVGRSEMLAVLLTDLAFIIVDHPELLDMENADDEGMAATHLAADMLIDYRMWADGMDRDTAQAWLTDPQFIKDFSAALDVYRETLDAPDEKAE
jgi:hypothetical protein